MLLLVIPGFRPIHNNRVSCSHCCRVSFWPPSGQYLRIPPAGAFATATSLSICALRLHRLLWCYPLVHTGRGGGRAILVSRDSSVHCVRFYCRIARVWLRQNRVDPVDGCKEIGGFPSLAKSPRVAPIGWVICDVNDGILPRFFEELLWVCHYIGALFIIADP